MREIEFRGKRKDTGEWWYGFYYKTLGKHIILGDTVQDSTAQRGILIDPETVGQYTGLRGKNGVKIFEEDIVKATLNDNGLFVVQWQDGKMGAVLHPIKDFPEWELIKRSGLEVIGNIHDNPELLEVQQC